jgi:hypothetical protein
MAVNNAALALEGNDPRDVVAKVIPLETMLLHNIHDPSVEFEEYLYWATITRADEKEAHARMTASDGPKTFKSIIANRFSKGKTGFDHSVALTGAPGPNEKSVAGDSSPREVGRTYVSDDEWRRASRATRTAGWSAIFYLITTDILGPFSVPWAFAQVSSSGGARRKNDPTNGQDDRWVTVPALPCTPSLAPWPCTRASRSTSSSSTWTRINTL